MCIRDRKYILRSLLATNVATANTEVNAIGAFDFNGGERSYMAYNIPIPVGMAAEMLRQPQVLNPSDKILLRSTDIDRNGVDSVIEYYGTYETLDSGTDYIGVGLGATANVFLGQVEAPLLIRPYLASMTRHELLVIMTAGMSTIAGSVMVVYTTMLSPVYGAGLIGHFLTASLISIPAAIMFANMMIPSEEKTEFPQNNSESLYSSSMDAITQGTKNGLEMFLNIIAMLIVVMALVFLINSILGLLPHFNGSAITLELILGYIFAPLAWFMGCLLYTSPSPRD